MKLLLDECVDWRLARDIVGHEVKTARQMGWTSIQNGELLSLAIQSGFEGVHNRRQKSFISTASSEIRDCGTRPSCPFQPAIRS